MRQYKILALLVFTIILFLSTELLAAPSAQEILLVRSAIRLLMAEMESIENEISADMQARFAPQIPPVRQIVSIQERIYLRSEEALIIFSMDREMTETPSNKVISRLRKEAGVLIKKAEKDGKVIFEVSLVNPLTRHPDIPPPHSFSISWPEFMEAKRGPSENLFLLVFRLFSVLRGENP